MVIKQEVAYSIIEAITDLRKGNDLEDFTVIVDGVSVRCHRFILGACSLFFRALLRSGMKEDEEKCVTLKTVSHPTFTLILSALYTGCDILTEENLVDVWHATNMLEIGFLVRECENFVEQNISINNFEYFYETAKLLDSERVLKTEHNFMAKNFDLIRTRQTLLKLSFSEMKALIETDQLVTNTEDNVVESVLQWVSYVPPQTSMLLEERQQRLLSLISNCRSCLLSPKCLEKLLLNPVIIDNPKVRSVVIKAVSYQLQPGYRHGQWPSAAIHRSNSQFKHVLLWAVLDRRDVRDRHVKLNARAFFSDNETLYELTKRCSSGQITNFDNELYELTHDGLCVFRDTTWRKIVSYGLSDKTFMISLENLIYILDGSYKILESVDPKANAPFLHRHTNFPGEFTVAGAVKYQDRILVFSFNAKEIMETVVHTFGPSNETWTRLENLQGPAENIISFHNDENTFLLQTNGNLWKVTDDSNSSLKIVFCKKAWDFYWKLYGAAIFRNKLVIVGDEMPADKHVSFSLPGSREKARAFTVKCNICVTPIILPCEYLKKTG